MASHYHRGTNMPGSLPAEPASVFRDRRDAIGGLIFDRDGYLEAWEGTHQAEGDPESGYVSIEPTPDSGHYGPTFSLWVGEPCECPEGEAEIAERGE
jgi:hypothetical protein